MKKVCKWILVLIGLSVTLIACNTDDLPYDIPGDPSVTTPDSNVEKPNTSGVPDIVIPSKTRPQVNDADLLGKANTTGAMAVITLQGTTASYTGTNVTISQDAKYGTVVELGGNSNSTFVIQGTLNQGLIWIGTSGSSTTVTLILNGVNIFSKNYAPIACLMGSSVIVELAEGSTNYLTDGGEGIDSDGRYNSDFSTSRGRTETPPNATLLIRRDLTIKGSGKLIVNGNANNGIASRRNLKIENGDIYSNAINNAIKGNDNVSITGGKFTIISQGNGIKTDEDSYLQDDLGDIAITGGHFEMAVINDGIQSERGLSISNATINMKTGGGSSAHTSTESAKGLKAEKDLVIQSGTFNIDSNDDGIHSNGAITIHNGTFNIASGDDGMHADDFLTIHDRIINISKSYEGLESTNITINDGNIKIRSSDDGINICGGRDGSGFNRPNPGRPGNWGSDSSVNQIAGILTINGGDIYINADGDGIDSNNNILISGGTIIIMGPTGNMDAAFDYDGTATMTGGTLIALGSLQMAQQPGSTSTQCSVLVRFSNNVVAGSEIKLETTSGTLIMSITTLKNARCLVFCSPLLQRGSSYRVTANGSTLKSFTINNMISTVN